MPSRSARSTRSTNPTTRLGDARPRLLVPRGLRRGSGGREGYGPEPRLAGHDEPGHERVLLRRGRVERLAGLVDGQGRPVGRLVLRRLAVAGGGPEAQGPGRHHPLGGHVGLLPRPVPARRHPVGQVYRLLVVPAGAAQPIWPTRPGQQAPPGRRQRGHGPGGHDRGRPAGRGPGGQPEGPDGR